MVQATTEREVATVNGVTWDPETGEILGGVEGFAVDSLERLEWWVGRIRDLRALSAADKVLADRASARASATQRAADGLFERFRLEAEPLARVNLPSGRKSLLLAHGEVYFRRVPGGVDIVDEAAALAWAKDNLPGAVRIEERILKRPVIEYAEQEGILPDGMVRREPEERMGVR